MVKAVPGEKKSLDVSAALSNRPPAPWEQKRDVKNKMGDVDYRAVAPGERPPTPPKLMDIDSGGFAGSHDTDYRKPSRVGQDTDYRKFDHGERDTDYRKRDVDLRQPQPDVDMRQPTTGPPWQEKRMGKGEIELPVSLHYSLLL